MKIGCIQLNVGFGKVEENFERARIRFVKLQKMGGQKSSCYLKCGIQAML